MQFSKALDLTPKLTRGRMDVALKSIKRLRFNGILKSDC
jgi:hypothetical protein